ncbi:MAG: excinuclease ABC subunit UvrA [Pseudomonadota bacterium]
MSRERIRIRGARQNNLKNLSLDLPLHEFIVVTGVSGSGKSSLAFDTIYAEGQRRYVETFSPYARQFLDRMDKPAVDGIDGIPPAIAIDQTNPVRTSRSTVGTMTELNDHLKLLYARAARLYCDGCGEPVVEDHPQSILDKAMQDLADARVAICFTADIPPSFNADEMRRFLAQQGYTRILAEDDKTLTVVQDRLRLNKDNASRFIESVEAALKRGNGHVLLFDLDHGNAEHPFSSLLHCASCERTFSPPTPSLFSFNSPIGACETCRGFGRTMGIDYQLVIPDESLTLREGAIKPIQSGSFRDLQQRLEKRAKAGGIPLDTPYKKLNKKQRRWLVDGEGRMREGLWPGITRIFSWLESKAYKMHVRVLLSRYRSYETCVTCDGARLKPDALRWRLGSKRLSGDVMQVSEADATPGINVHEMMLLPITRLQQFFHGLELGQGLDQAVGLLLDEINARVGFLADTGLGYLTLDRQSRTLSGGEVQRINLTTALGTSLVNTLFVLDEPSIGLHPRDISRINKVLLKLARAGNTLLVVEHDPQIMYCADRVIDVGPGPGEHGGEIVFNGSLPALARSKKSRTAPYLTGKQRVADCRRRRAVTHAGARIGIRGATHHNLKDIDVDLPLRALVCVTGVSGSGKSTLIGDILYPALGRELGGSGPQPGHYKKLVGAKQIDEVVYVDQSPIGKTTRSNPASFVGAFDAIRKLFTAQPLAKERGYKPGTFSFNSGNGRCPTCGGNGFEHIEMQFLSDVYLRCPECDGKRFREEILEVRIWPASDNGPSLSIADVLEMTVSQAIVFFADQPEVLRVVEPLAAVGLAYVKLGQPVPTLSGGEAQRLKLAKHLGEARRKRGAGKGKLFLFDEPTTGLHFSDIEKLLGAFDQLLDEGNSIVVIEHNLDVIDAADWIIDLGPEGGEAGGQLLFAGTTDALLAGRDNSTGAALRDYRAASGALNAAAEAAAEYLPEQTRKPAADRYISILKAREHNLKDIDLKIPRNKFTTITGVSGSGKSTIAFDILFNEGQRRYLESLNAYARQFVQPASRPDVDAVTGIPPTVAIEQRTSRGGRKSTVGTMTEIYHFLRLLFVKLGTAHCPDCNTAIEPQTIDQVLATLQKQCRGKTIRLLAPLVTARKGYYTDLAKWAANKGFDALRVDGEMIPVNPWPRLDRFIEHNIELPVASVRVSKRNEAELAAALRRALDFGKGVVMVDEPATTQPPELFSTERACPSCQRSFAELDPRLFSYNSAHGWCPSCTGTGTVNLEDDDPDQWWRSTRYESTEVCEDCDGKRLNAESLAVRFRKRSIADVANMPVSEAQQFFASLSLDGRQAEIGRDALTELMTRLDFLSKVGLDYLTLSRAAPSLSGGEAQRIRLASQLGSNLRGVCYILDEPTIGLHARDNARLLEMLKALQRNGNTVVVVEHDEDTIRGSQHLIDIGPGAGVRGGQVVAQGTVSSLMRSTQSLTGKMLREPLSHPFRDELRDLSPRKRSTPVIQVTGATLNNLKRINVKLPLGGLVAISGVSGSGKSSLIRGVVQENVARLVASTQRRGRSKPALVGCKSLEGWQSIKRVLEVDQTPIGKTPRSCPATYIGFWDAIRQLFAQTPEARMRGYTASRFSFNTKDGRCPECDGQGMRKIEMSFMPDVRVECESCRGQRFTPETLTIRYRDKSIGEVLTMNVEDAAEFFIAHPKIHHALCLLRDVGLGYLTLGQPSPTLSGGEAQRIKLVTELAKARPDAGQPITAAMQNPNHTLYVLDEPTIGLHMADVARLIEVLQRLVDTGHSVFVIEHNLDIIAEADWIVDLGPEGGALGGRISAQGAPSQVIDKKDKSYTANALSTFLRRDELPKTKTSTTI